MTRNQNQPFLISATIKTSNTNLEAKDNKKLYGMLKKQQFALRTGKGVFVRQFSPTTTLFTVPVFMSLGEKQFSVANSLCLYVPSLYPMHPSDVHCRTRIEIKKNNFGIDTTFFFGTFSGWWFLLRFFDPLPFSASNPSLTEFLFLGCKNRKYPWEIKVQGISKNEDLT